MYDNETGEFASSDDVTWTITSKDTNAYTGTETEDEGDLLTESKYLVTVDKSANSIATGDTFKFKVSGTHSTYGKTASANITVVIGDRPIMFFDETEVTMGEENYIWAEGYADGNYIAVGNSSKITLNSNTEIDGSSYLSVNSDDSEIIIDLTDVSNDEIKVGDTLTFTVDLKNSDDDSAVGSITHTVTVVQAPPKVLVNGYDVDNVLAGGTYSLTADGETDGWTFEIIDGDGYASISGTTLTVGSDNNKSFTVKACLLYTSPSPRD